jgi:hypothetical protein
MSRAAHIARVMGDAVSAGTWQRCRCSVFHNHTLLLREVDERLACTCTTGCNVDAVARGVRDMVMAKRRQRPDWVRPPRAETAAECIEEREDELAREAEAAAREEWEIWQDPAVRDAADPAEAACELREQTRRKRADAAAGRVSSAQFKELLTIAPMPDGDKPPPLHGYCGECFEKLGEHAYAGLLPDGSVTRVGDCCAGRLVHIVITEDLVAGTWDGRL